MKFSSFLFFISACVLIYSGSFFYPRWKHSAGEAQLSWDAAGYYWYLPSVFIYHDVRGQNFHQQILDKYHPTPPNDFQYAFRQNGQGNYIIRYTMGVSVLEMPFFTVAHIIAKPMGYPSDGFSFPYQLMIYIGGIFFSLLGVWYLRKLLLYYYNDRTAGWTILLLVIGTNFLDMCGINVGMSHCWLFTVYVLLILNTHYYYLTFKRKYALGIGLFVGLATLIRPPEFISVLIPLLWGMESISIAAIKERLQLIKKRLLHFLIASIIGGLIISLQLFYWKYASGHWLVYTYQDQKFVWLHPHIKLYAFNYQSGWLLYTPLMLLAILGIIFFLKSGKNKVALIAFTFINYYVVASWDSWDYGGRAMVQSYPVWFFMFAAMLEYLQKKKIALLIAAPVLVLFTYFNIWYTYQAHVGTLIGSVPTTREYYWRTIFRYQLPIEIQKLRDNKDYYENAVNNPILLYNNDFENTKLGKIILNQEQVESNVYNLPKPMRNVKWIRASADIYIDEKEWNVWFMTMFIIRFKQGEKIIQENNIRLQRLLNDGEIKNIFIDAEVRNQDYDHIEILFRNDNNGTLPCMIDNLKVIGFNN